MLRALRVAHRWLGLALMLPMLLQGVTGCILVATPVWEAMRPVPAPSPGVPGQAGAIVAAALREGLVAVRYQPAPPDGPAVVELGLPGQRGSQRQMLVDPVTLEVVGERASSTAYRIVHGLHEMLLVPVAGRSVVGWFGVGLLALGLSGIVLWWPTPRIGRWREAIGVPRGARGVRLQRSLHGAVGFWVSAMLVVMSLTGVTLSFPQATRALLGLPEGRLAGGGPPGRGPASEGPAVLVDVDAVLARAAEAAPDARLADIRLPTAPGRPAFVRLLRPDAWDAALPVIVLVDPSGRRIVSVQDPRSQPGAGVALAWMRALHAGDAVGWPWRLLVFATGLALPVLAVTGLTLWLLKRRNRRRVLVRREAALMDAAQ